MRSRSIDRGVLLSLLMMLGLMPLIATHAKAQSSEASPLKARRILFLGDSITHSGGYIARIEAQLRAQKVSPLPEIINLGLSSETCSGLSEPDHPFPRPDVHERLQRALDKIQPDLVVACYGMNDGIYHPFSEERFAAYQDGVNRLIEKVHASGAKLILLTPPPFDPVPLRASGNLRPLGSDQYAYFAMYEDYDRVLERYAAWILEQKDRVAMVVDLHGPITRQLVERRKTEPEFTVAPDGIHPNETGHQWIAQAILEAWGMGKEVPVPDDVQQLLARRNALLHDAYLSDVGHQRPGVGAGLPLEQAQAEAEALDRKATARLLDSSEK